MFANQKSTIRDLKSTQMHYNTQTFDFIKSESSQNQDLVMDVSNVSLKLLTY